jgi:hypothetical protein
MMEAIRSSKTLVFTRITRCHIWEESSLRSVISPHVAAGHRLIAYETKLDLWSLAYDNTSHLIRLQNIFLGFFVICSCSQWGPHISYSKSRSGFQLNLIFQVWMWMHWAVAVHCCPQLGRSSNRTFSNFLPEFRGENRWSFLNKPEMIWKKSTVVRLRYNPSIFLEPGLRKPPRSSVRTRVWSWAFGIRSRTANYYETSMSKGY